MAIMGIKKSICVVMLLVCAVAAVGCQSTKKQAHYSDIYKEQPSTIYVAPIVDHSLRRAVRSTEDSAYNASLNTAAQQLFLTATDPLVNNGYYVPGPLASAQLAATEARTGRQLRNENLSDYAHDLGIDAILFITLNRWSDAGDGWTVEVEYVLRSTTSGNELMHAVVEATKRYTLDFKKRPVANPLDQAFADSNRCDLATAQRCRLVEVLNRYVLKDLPSGRHARQQRTERYIASHPEFFTLRIQPDESVEVVKNELELFD